MFIVSGTREIQKSRYKQCLRVNDDNTTLHLHQGLMIIEDLKLIKKY